MQEWQPLCVPSSPWRFRLKQGHSSCREAAMFRSPVRESREERNASVPRTTGDGQTALYLKNVTLPEWLTGSPAIRSCQRLGFARECSNRSGDDFLLPSSSSKGDNEKQRECFTGRRTSDNHAYREKLKLNDEIIQIYKTSARQRQEQQYSLRRNYLGMLPNLIRPPVPREHTVRFRFQ